MRALLTLALLAGCGTYNVNRAALVPRATPHMSTGTPMTGRGQLDAGLASVAHFGDIGAGDESAGVEVPGTQIHAAAKLRVGDIMSIGIIYQNGLDSGAKPIHDTQPEVNNGNVEGYGLSLDAVIPTGDPRLNVGLGVAAINWQVPYVEYSSCARGESCFPYRLMETGVDGVSTFGVALTPSFRVDDAIVLFGQLHLRNHPTVTQKSVETDPILFDDTEIESGPANVVVAAGIEAGLADGAILLSALAYYDVTQNPVEYKPGLALMMSVPLGRESLKRQKEAAKQPVMYPPPPPYYGPPPAYPAPYAPQPYPPPPYPPAPAPPPYPPAPAPAQ